MTQYINPLAQCTSLGGKNSYAISTQGGFLYLEKKGFPVDCSLRLSEYVLKKKKGEIGKLEQFLKAGTAEIRIKKAVSRKRSTLRLSYFKYRGTRISETSIRLKPESHLCISKHFTLNIGGTRISENSKAETSKISLKTLL